MLTVEWVVGVPWQVLSSDESDAPEETLSP